MSEEPVDPAPDFSAERLERVVLAMEDEHDRRASYASRAVPDEREVPPPSDLDLPTDELGARRKQKKARAKTDELGGSGDHAGLGPKGGYRRTDLGNAKRFADTFADQLRYVPPWGQWLLWDGKRWRRDNLGNEIRAAKQVVAAIYAEAAAFANAAASAAAGAGDTNTVGPATEQLSRWARESAKRPRIEAMVALSRTEPELVTSREVFDANRWLLNVANGTIDLRDGEIRKHQQSDMITMLANVEYHADALAPRWEAFLARALPDEETRAWVQRYLGYALTGDVREQCLSFFVGGGANGKSVLLDVVLGVIGDYGLRAAPDLVLARYGDAHPTELADLEGKRMVVCSEIEQGRMWAESVIKRITGDTTITARRMKQDFFTFPATHKLIVAANTKPSVRGTDHGIWRRMRLVPWTVQIPEHEQDRELPQRLLESEAPGILAWLVRGCLGWQRLGLGRSQAIESATGAYRSDEDVLGRWIADRCEVGDGFWYPTDGLYKDYKTWCSEEGIEKPWTRRTWHARMCEREGVEDFRKTLARGLRGVQLRGIAQTRYDA